jgi:NTE family protein
MELTRNGTSLAVRSARHPRNETGWNPSGLGSTPGRLAIVLGGGANLGAYQVGVIDVLARAGLRPDQLVGTSVGALNAAVWACFPGPDAGERLLGLWEAGGVSKVLAQHGWWLQLVRHSDHLFGSGGLRSLIAHGISATQRIEDTSIPLAVIATDFETGQRVVLRRGNLAMALLASTAIPGLFRPIEIGGRLLVDGGVVANVDLHAAVESGSTHAVVVDVMGEPPLAHSMTALQAFDRTLLLAARRQTDLLLEAERGRINVSLLRPQLPWLPPMSDFSHTRELFEMGRTAAQGLLGGPSALTFNPLQERLQ